MDSSLHSPTLIAIRSWQDALRALVPLAEVFASTAALLVGVTLIAELPAVQDFVHASPYRAWLAGVFFDICRVFFAAPLVIAVCRYVLLGEEIQAYRFVCREKRPLIFFVFLNFLFLSQAAFSAMAGAAKSLGAVSTGTLSLLFSATLLLALAIAIFAVVLKLLLFIPALAIEVEGAGFGAPLSGEAGRFWMIFQTLLLTGAPVAVAVLGFALWSEAGYGREPTSAFQPLFSFFVPLWLAVAAAMASRLHQMLG